MRFITNCFTRLRYVDSDGKLCLAAKGPIGSQPSSCIPWFQHPGRETKEVLCVFGHWSTLGFYSGNGIVAMDSGCLWGGKLTAVRLDVDASARVPLQVTCKAARQLKKTK
jgi:bis(5'-nucleosyl)-tetraphosphatase (symmetrical)